MRDIHETKKKKEEEHGEKYLTSIYRSSATEKKQKQRCIGFLGEIIIMFSNLIQFLSILTEEYRVYVTMMLLRWSQFHFDLVVQNTVE